ncbi:oxidoreductase, short chain dehydrogenase/reductase family protein [Bordetella bronchiseptica MBORD635]|uniref:SDR family oxidoreductase n=1 Tax=Bordetella bronchiseptica TaxID=518 RepID=UPI0002904399|nr:SDR family oxidoreductase [Bordetella bronchiseptica]AWP81502.1 short chain dehydrogenase [Bordetella bronchiseptica]KDC38307.1 oxidoreductase, short chain dehydrogenase/reductase family protein [Bordetella bronchiseptica M435/02/3]KDC75573.1 oxidoreductase, short chain dehydrogenase/reductase family protein [Bordetella bronchiseptica MBORD635]CCN24685.1 short chain dehydrogenase [Bordetella bronchiseptica 1289]SUV71154.1 short-chain dehydrogenase/reductase [Bordetella bronchiseptica]
MPMFRFPDQRVLVVGGSSGIGLAAAAAFAQAGARVTIAARDPQRLRTAAEAADCDARVLDATRDADVAAFAAEHPAWDHVVVSAAHTPTGSVRGLPLADAQLAMDSKFWSAYRIAKHIPIAPGGSLTFVSGFLAARPNAASVPQGAINAALEALGRGLALELAPVRVNTVSPGLIETPLWDRAGASARTAAFARAQSTLPVRRVGRPDDVARAILYLAGTGFATGSTVVVDGGGSIA